MQSATPKILWLADVSGWAFENRAKDLKERMPGYDHEILVVSETSRRRSNQKDVDWINSFDVIIIPFTHKEVSNLVVDKRKLAMITSSHRCLNAKC